MKLDMKMTLKKDAILGNGVSVPGGEDISVLTDRDGFPYYKGGTFKGVFREELEHLTAWEPELKIDVSQKLGSKGDDVDSLGKLHFHDFVISPSVKRIIRNSVDSPEDILDSFTYLRTFTAIDHETGVVDEGTLRVARCIKSGITFYGSIDCDEADLDWIQEVLGLVKWIGTMRNRGFGEVKIETINGRENG